MSYPRDPNRKPIDARPRNVYHTADGQRVVGPTSAELSAQTSTRQYRGGQLYQSHPLYQSRPLTQGGGLDGYYAMQKSGPPEPQKTQSPAPARPPAPPPATIKTAEDGSRTLTSPYGKGSSTPGQPGVKPAGDPKLRAEIAAMKDRHSRGIYGSQVGQMLQSHTTLPSLDPKRDAEATGTMQLDTASAFKKELPPMTDLGGPRSAGPGPTSLPQQAGEASGTLQGNPGAAFRQELPPLNLGLPPLMGNSYAQQAHPPQRMKKTLLA